MSAIEERVFAEADKLAEETGVDKTVLMMAMFRGVRFAFEEAIKINAEAIEKTGQK